MQVAGSSIRLDSRSRCKALGQLLLGDRKMGRTVWLGPLDSRESFNTHLVSTYSLLGAVLAMGHRAIDETDKVHVLSGWGDRQRRKSNVQYAR